MVVLVNVRRKPKSRVVKKWECCARNNDEGFECVPFLPGTSHLKEALLGVESGFWRLLHSPSCFAKSRAAAALPRVVLLLLCQKSCCCCSAKSHAAAALPRVVLLLLCCPATLPRVVSCFAKDCAAFPCCCVAKSRGYRQKVLNFHPVQESSLLTMWYFDPASPTQPISFCTFQG
jgi:hypothetical protein